MKLREIEINGFKSIDSEGQRIPLGDVTVLLGANGCGKSNLVSFFTMLNSVATGALQQHVGKQGVARILFGGPKATGSLSFIARFSSENANDEYHVTLAYGLPDRLFFTNERVVHREAGAEAQDYYLDSGGSETELAKAPDATSQGVASLLSRIRAYQFHDTSDRAKIRDRGAVDDSTYLRSNAANLAAFLRMLREHQDYARHYRRIVRHIQRVMPQFGDFSLDLIPGNKDYVRLNWTDVDQSDYLFDPAQISDGSLRFMALAALLLQPPALLPKFIVLDEPELGLHPVAIGELAGMIKVASNSSQILIATQSARLVDEFSADQVVVVERNAERRGSTFRQLSAAGLGEWIECCSLSELWEKNVLGGQP